MMILYIPSPAKKQVISLHPQVFLRFHKNKKNKGKYIPLDFCEK